MLGEVTLETYLYQIQYNEQTKPAADSGLMAFDCRQQPELLKREMAHMIRFYDQVVCHADPDAYFALLSPKFSQKTGLSIAQLQSYLRSDVDQDIYIFNPYPKLVYGYLNVIEHGEKFHPGLKLLFKDLFHKANIDFDVDTIFRNGNDTACFCNYWVAKKSFWDEFIALVKKLDNLVENLPAQDRDRYFSNTEYVVDACFYPFIFERIISVYLVMHKNKYRVKDYQFSKNFIKSCKLGRVFDSFYFNGGKTHFDRFERNTNDVDIIAEKLLQLGVFFNVKVQRGEFYFFRKLFCSVIKHIRCITVLIFTKKLAMESECEKKLNKPAC